MSFFYPNESHPIASEMIRQDCTPDTVEALRITRIDESAASTDVAVSVVGCVVSIASVCGMAALAGFTLPILVPLATFGLSSLCAWNARITQKEREEESVFLSEHPQVLDLMKSKLDQGEARAKVAAAYEVAMDRYFHKHKEPLKCLGQVSVALPAGVETKLRAVEVESEEVEDDRLFDKQYEESIADYIQRTPANRPVEKDITVAQSSPAPLAANPWDKPQAKPVNPIDTLGNKLESLLLIAATGAGKGIVISNLIRHFYQKHSDLRTYAFDGKDDPNETGYWSEGFQAVVRINLDLCSPVDAANAILHLIHLVDTAQGSSPSILLIDEANTLILVLENGLKYGEKEDKQLCGQALGTVKRKISTSASTGNSREKYVWAIGQNPNLSSLGLNGGDANQLRKVAIAYLPKPTLTDQIVLATGFTGKQQDSTYRSKIDDLIEASPIDRAFYDSALAQTTENRGWFPMAQMQNYSGFDRDSRKQIGAPNSIGLPPSKILSGHGSNRVSAVVKKTESVVPKPENDPSEAVAEQLMLKETPERVVKRKATYADLVQDAMVEAAEFIRDHQNHVDNAGTVKVRDFVQGTSNKESRAVREKAVNYLLSYYPEKFAPCDEVIKGQISRRVKAIS